MKQVMGDKYSIAWFKIAEFIARGERERALGVYRLLSHSIHDKAIAEQLAGDIFFSLQDIPDAISKYKEAAREYGSSQRSLYAAGIYHHLIVLDPGQAFYYLRQLIDIYQALNLPEKIDETMLSCAKKYHTEGNKPVLQELLTLAQKMDRFAIVDFLTKVS